MVHIQKRVLDGIRVLDCTSAMAGPYCGKLLAELGAEVIKIEPPNGSLHRQGKMFSPYKGESYASIIVDANKKFITLNLKTERGKEILMELVKKSDVFNENYGPETMNKLVGGYQEIKKVNPRLIYCHITGFGTTGPLKEYPGYAWIAEARSGLMDVEGFPECPPVTDGVASVDTWTGTFAALCILAALYARTKTNRGQKVDIGLLDVAVNSLMEQFGMYFASNREYVPTRWGNRGNYTPEGPTMCYKAKDGYVLLVFFKDSDWADLVQAMGKKDLKGDNRYNSFEKRTERREEVEEIIGDWIKTKTKGETCELLKKKGFSLCAPVQRIDEAYKEPQAKARRMFAKVKHPTLGEVELSRSPLNLSETPGKIEWPGCPLGYHNSEIYGKLLGYSNDEVDRLREDRVI